MLRVRPGVELVRASLVPTSELITLDFPTFDRPRKAISGNSKAGKCATSVAAARNRVRTLMLQIAMQDGKLASRHERPGSSQLSFVKFPQRRIYFFLTRFERRFANCLLMSTGRETVNSRC